MSFKVEYEKLLEDIEKEISNPKEEDIASLYSVYSNRLKEIISRYTKSEIYFYLTGKKLHKKKNESGKKSITRVDQQHGEGFENL